MPIATRQEGPRAPLFYCALLIAPVQFALAQSVDLSELERCASLESATAKLACYEALTPVSEPSAPPEIPEAQTGTTAGEAAAEPDDSPPAAASPEPSPAASTAAPATTGSSRATEAVQSAVPVEPTVAVPARASAEPAAAARDPMEGLGRDEPEPEAITGRVTQVTKDGYGRLVFEFENGQVWRQFEKRYYPYPKNREFDATISVGMMGDHRLQVEGAGRKVLIKRLR